jgi:hypothetical protein
MRNLRIMIGVFVLAMGSNIAQAQSARSSKADARLVFSSSSPADVSPASGEILREIDDPRNGDRWLLLRDEDHPAGPGRLVLVSALPSMENSANQTGRRPDAPSPVIRPGDHIVVEEHSALVDARLEAVATEPAWSGSVFSARLTLGGRIVRARAAGPGRATLREVAGQ